MQNNPPNQNRKILSLPSEADRKKYRPVFSASLLQHIEILAREDYMKNNSAKSLAIVGIVAPFLAKISAGAMNPVYTEKEPKVSLMESLGAVDPKGQNSKEQISKEDYWGLCYDKLLNNPSLCTIAEIQAAKEYKYLHGLMSAEEIQDFEELSNKHNYK